MSDATPSPRADPKPQQGPDGHLQIHRRRAGVYQPKDSLGLSCIMQGRPEDDNLLRRRSLPAPPDNIGISCLPTKDARKALEASKSLDLDNPDSEALLTAEQLLKAAKNKKSEAEKEKGPNKPLLNIGISNIRRPKNVLKPQKPILPKNNIGLCCQLLRKPTLSTTNLQNLEKKSNNALGRKHRIDRTQSAPKLTQSKTVVLKEKQKINVKKSSVSHKPKPPKILTQSKK